MKKKIRIEHRNSNNSQHVSTEEMETAKRWLSKNSNWIENESENENMMATATVNTEATLGTTHRIVKEVTSILRIEIGIVTGARGLDGSGMGMIETPMVTIDAALMARREVDLLNNE